MTKINTDELREEGKNATDRERYELLCDALDEIDRLEERINWQSVVEQRTKEACKKAIQDAYERYGEAWDAFSLMLQAIDAVGSR